MAAFLHPSLPFHIVSALWVPHFTTFPHLVKTCSTENYLSWHVLSPDGDSQFSVTQILKTQAIVAIHICTSYYHVLSFSSTYSLYSLHIFTFNTFTIPEMSFSLWQTTIFLYVSVPLRSPAPEKLLQWQNSFTNWIASIVYLINSNIVLTTMDLFLCTTFILDWKTVRLKFIIPSCFLLQCCFVVSAHFDSEFNHVNHFGQ